MAFEGNRVGQIIIADTGALKLTLLGGIQGTTTRKKETKVKNTVTGSDALTGGLQDFAQSGRCLTGIYVASNPSETAAFTTFMGYDDKFNTKLYACNVEDSQQTAGGPRLEPERTSPAGGASRIINVTITCHVRPAKGALNGRFEANTFENGIKPSRPRA